MPADPALSPNHRGERGARRKERRIAALADRQHGVVTRAQLAEVGFSAGAIDRRIARRRLNPVHRGVYAVGHRRLTAKGVWMAAAMIGDALSVRSAAALWDLRPWSGAVDVTVRSWRRPTSGIRWHESSLAADEVTVKYGIPVTTVARTLLDLASVLRREQLEQAIGRAESRLLTDAPSLPALVARHRGRRGMATLRAVLADGRIGLDLPRSELELRFKAFLRQRGLPLPEVNVLVDLGSRWIEVDCLWRAAALVAELDGHAYHGHAGAFESDRGRDRALVARGYRCIRITSRALELEPEAIAADLRASLSGRTHP
jgi:very-short-patch-repair endonuclease